MVTKTKIPKKIVSLYMPILFQSVNGKYLIVAGSEEHGGWYPVDDDFDMNKVIKNWTQTSFQKEEEKPNNPWSWQIQNSKKNGYYTVEFDKRGWTCTCPGFGFRRDCKHIAEAKTKMN